MDEKLKHEFREMLIEQRNTPTGLAVIMAMVAMVEDDERFENLAELYAGIEEFDNFITEKEARKIVEGYVNFDKSRGAKWAHIEQIDDELRKFGGVLAEKRHYNKWVMFVKINQMYSDYGGVLTKVAQGNDLVKLCYMMALANIDDPDRRETIREEFDLE